MQKKIVLKNLVDQRVLKQRIAENPIPRVTLSFYKYHPIADPQAFRDELYMTWSELGVLGRIYVASEGVNAQLSVPEENFERFKEVLFAVPFLNGVRLNIAIEQDPKSFYVLKIKVRPKIVADGIDDPLFNPSDTGTHLSAEAYNELTDRPDTVIVDMRNFYESEVGHFQNAILPDVETFRESLPIVADMLDDAKDKNVVMYCTGGIRCEKASAYMKYRGFKNVFQLDGGIIEYARQCEQKKLKNKFLGVNFVFDERHAERISSDIIAKCHFCDAPCDTHHNCANTACNALMIQCDDCRANMGKCCSKECLEILLLPEEEKKSRNMAAAPGKRYVRK